MHDHIGAAHASTNCFTVANVAPPPVNSLSQFPCLALIQRRGQIEAGDLMSLLNQSLQRRCPQITQSSGYQYTHDRLLRIRDRDTTAILYHCLSAFSHSSCDFFNSHEGACQSILPLAWGT